MTHPTERDKAMRHDLPCSGCIHAKCLREYAGLSEWICLKHLMSIRGNMLVTYTVRADGTSTLCYEPMGNPTEPAGS